MTQTSSQAEAKRIIFPGRFILFWVIALAGAAFDLATKSYFFRTIGEPYLRPPWAIIPNVLELQTNYNPGSALGFHADGSS